MTSTTGRARNQIRSRARTTEGIEKLVLTPETRGKYEWPVEIVALGETMRLRLETGKNRILYDWVVPEQYRAALGRPRFKSQIPARPGTPRMDDPGHNAERAVEWAKSWLRDRIVEAESGGLSTVENGREVPNSVGIERLGFHYKRSEDWLKVSKDTQDQYSKWIDFMVQIEPGPGFELNRLDGDTAGRIVRRYQEPWERTMSDGSVRLELGREYNTAVKVAELLKRMCCWGLRKSIGAGRYLLDVDPYQRLDAKKLPKQLRSKMKPKGTAGERFVAAMFDHAGLITPSGQWKPILAVERYTGRRIAEGRLLNRCDYLTSPAEIADAMYRMRCREFFKERHIHVDEIDEVARRYAEQGGAIYFRMQNVKQVNQRKGEPTQYDIVIPICHKLAAILDEYLVNHWEPLGLPADAPLFPAQRNSRRRGRPVPTPKATTETWSEKNVALVRAYADLRPHELPNGKTHPFRGRIRELAEKHNIAKPTLGLYAAWTALTGDAMDDHYLPIRPDDLLRVARLFNEHA
jgi:hypothetical protein